MVLISVKIRGNKAYIVLLPLLALLTMLESHLGRKFSDKTRTCFVKQGDYWEEKPRYSEVIDLLLKTLQVQRVLNEGEYPYPIPHPENIKCREFTPLGEPGDQIFNGDFVMNLIRIRGGAPLIRKTLNSIEKINETEYKKIENTIKKLEEKELLIYLVVHIHPAKSKKSKWL